MKEQESNKRELPEVYIDDVLMTLKFFTDEHDVHLAIKDPKYCRQCEDKPCIDFCPGGGYSVDETGGVQIAVQSCIECGTCRVLCPYDNIRWKNPRGGFGVAYKFG